MEREDEKVPGADGAARTYTEAEDLNGPTVDWRIRNCAPNPAPSYSTWNTWDLSPEEIRTPEILQKLKLKNGYFVASRFDMSEIEINSAASGQPVAIWSWSIRNI